MRREIKFRLTLHGEIVGYEKWYPGSKNHETAAWKALPKWLYSVVVKCWNPRAIIHDGKDQRTCFKDKNGVEIYEKDVVKIFMVRKGKMEVYWESCEVFSRNGRWNCGFPEGQGKDLRHWTGDPDNYAVEVIGNTHESKLETEG